MLRQGGVKDHLRPLLALAHHQAQCLYHQCRFRAHRGLGLIESFRLWMMSSVRVDLAELLVRYMVLKLSRAHCQLWTVISFRVDLMERAVKQVGSLAWVPMLSRMQVMLVLMWS